MWQLPLENNLSTINWWRIIQFL